MRIYLQGLTMGLAYVAPIGLQNLFVINSALAQRRSRVYLLYLIHISIDHIFSYQVILQRAHTDIQSAQQFQNVLRHITPVSYTHLPVSAS